MNNTEKIKVTVYVPKTLNEAKWVLEKFKNKRVENLDPHLFLHYFEKGNGEVAFGIKDGTWQVFDLNPPSLLFDFTIAKIQDTAKINRPTTYVVRFYTKDGSTVVGQEIYPMHKYSLDEVIENLKGREGKEDTCDIYECRYWKDRDAYVTVGETYVWQGCGWYQQL